MLELLELENDVRYLRPFAFDVLIKAHETGPNGEWIVSGPIAPEGEDYDTDILTDVGLTKGLQMYAKLNRQVDFAHMYDKTHEPKWLIGTGAPFRGPDGRWWLKTVLDKASDIARQLWQKINGDPPQPFGYSIRGFCKLRHPQDHRKIIDTEIHRITIDPSPKGFGNFLQIGLPAPQSATALAKSVLSDLEQPEPGAHWMTPDAYRQAALASPAVADELLRRLQSVEEVLRHGTALMKATDAQRQRCQQAHLRERTPSDKDRRCESCRFWTAKTGDCAKLQVTTGKNDICDLWKAGKAACPHCGAMEERGDDGTCNRCGKAWPMEKALTTGAGVVQPGATGGQTLRRQELTNTVYQVRCGECGTKNRSTRPKCRKCGAVMRVQKAAQDLAELLKAYMGFDKLQSKLAHRPGVTDPGALAAYIGRKKYGKRAMARASHSGHSLRGARPLQKCAACGTGNRASRTECRHCGKSLELSKALFTAVQALSPTEKARWAALLDRAA